MCCYIVKEINASAHIMGGLIIALLEAAPTAICRCLQPLLPHPAVPLHSRHAQRLLHVSSPQPTSIAGSPAAGFSEAQRSAQSPHLPFSMTLEPSWPLRSSAAGCTALLVPLQQPQTDARAAVQQVDGCHVVDSVQAQPLLLPLLVTAVVSDNGASVAMSVGVSARWPCSGLHQPAAGLG